MLYCIEVTRKLEKLCVLHKEFEKEPTREEVLKYVEDQDLNYDDNYGKIKYYKVN